MKKLKLNKNFYMTLGILLAVLIVVLSVVLVKINSTDGAKFKREYEKLNGEKVASGAKYQTIKVPRNNKMKYSTMSEAIELLDKGTGLIYFGMSDCPWCRNVVPVLIEKTNCSCLDDILYIDMSEARNTYEIIDESPKETKEADKEYYELLHILDEYLDNYTITDEDGVEHVLNEKRIYLPLVVAVKNGAIVGAHTGTVELSDDQTAFDKLTDTQKSELGVVFDNMLKELAKEKTTCGDKC